MFEQLDSTEIHVYKIHFEESNSRLTLEIQSN